MYQFVEKLHTLYELLQDERSKEIFWARFAIDMEDSIPNYKRLAALGNLPDHAFMPWLQPVKDEVKKLNQENKKIILYGTAKTSKLFAEVLQLEHLDFYGFCGRGAKNFPNGLFGKPVLSPDKLVSHGDEYYVIPAVGKASYLEISQFLQEHNYPKDHILERVDINPDRQWILAYLSDSLDIKQYFEFPELYHPGTAFIDGGCLDCVTSYRFAKWCKDTYSSIIAFEPHPDSYADCCKKIQEVPLRDFQLINAGLSNQEGTASFDATTNATGGSSIILDSNTKKSGQTKHKTDIKEISIRTVALDDIVGEQTVGFIKLDIEGAELDALRGAKNTIIRDKPLLAICVYHKRGDICAMMDYLHQLLPEYRFLLRHHSDFLCETVLYASVDL